MKPIDTPYDIFLINSTRTQQCIYFEIPKKGNDDRFYTLPDLIMDYVDGSIPKHDSGHSIYTISEEEYKNLFENPQKLGSHPDKTLIEWIIERDKSMHEYNLSEFLALINLKEKAEKLLKQ